MKTVTKYKQHAGFTLLEVMVSLSIIAVIFISVFRMQSESIRLAAQGKFNTLAPVLAGRLLSDIEADLDSWSDTQGRFDSPFAHMAWECAISDGVAADPEVIEEKYGQAVKKIDIRIFDPQQAVSYSVTTWRFIHDAVE